LRNVKVHAVDLRAGRRTGNVSRGRIPVSSEHGMLEQFPPQPDDTVELAAVPAHRPIALIVSAAVVAIGVLIGVGFLAFGGLGGSAGGIRSPGLLPAISAEPDTSTPPPATSSSSAPPTTATPAPTPVRQTPTPTGTPSTPPAVAVSITNATMKPPTYAGPDCPGSTTGVATVTATGPVTIAYRWVSTAIAAPASGNASFTFGAAGSHQFSHAFPNIMTPNGQVAAAFVVVTPVSRRASMTYTQKCGASASNITPKITKEPSGLCSVTFTSTIHAGVGPMTVNYHWEITPAGPAGDSGSWTFPQGGGNHHVASSTRTLKHGGSATATLVLGTPVRFVTGTVTATCS
jgi:hypothetical protein